MATTRVVFIFFTCLFCTFTCCLSLPVETPTKDGPPVPGVSPVGNKNSSILEILNTKAATTVTKGVPSNPCTKLSNQQDCVNMTTDFQRKLCSQVQDYTHKYCLRTGSTVPPKMPVGESIEGICANLNKSVPHSNIPGEEDIIFKVLRSNLLCVDYCKPVQNLCLRFGILAEELRKADKTSVSNSSLLPTTSSKSITSAIKEIAAGDTTPLEKKNQMKPNVAEPMKTTSKEIFSKTVTVVTNQGKPQIPDNNTVTGNPSGSNGVNPGVKKSPTTNTHIGGVSAGKPDLQNAGQFKPALNNGVPSNTGPLIKEDAVGGKKDIATTQGGKNIDGGIAPGVKPNIGDASNGKVPASGVSKNGQPGVNFNNPLNKNTPVGGASNTQQGSLGGGNIPQKVPIGSSSNTQQGSFGVGNVPQKVPIGSSSNTQQGSFGVGNVPQKIPSDSSSNTQGSFGVGNIPKKGSSGITPHENGGENYHYNNAQPNQYPHENPGSYNPNRQQDYFGGQQQYNGVQRTRNPKNEKSLLHHDEYNETPSSAHFMGYFLTAIVLCIAGYVVFHNKGKIIAFIIEGRNQKRNRRPNSGEYKKLQTNVDDVMSSLEKTTTAKNYIY